jgi:hypothetical protein
VTREPVFDVSEGILHARCGGGLRHARLVSRQLEQLDEAVFVVARQSERIANRILKCHVTNDSTPERVSKGAK